MPAKTLKVLLRGEAAGAIRTLETGRLEFAYDRAWLQTRPRMPISRGLPLTEQPLPDRAVAPFLWGLLPENDRTLSRIADAGDERVSPRNVAALLGKVGLDCAGAVQILADQDQRAGGTPDGAAEWLTERQIGGLIRQLRSCARATSQNAVWGGGCFCVAGAQPKFALTVDPATGAYGLPSLDTPSTHIFKPPMPGLASQLENEHFCLSLASALGLAAVESRIMVFDGEPIIAVSRYDRFVTADGAIGRIHQEDMCQALSVHPARKYQSDGGPSAADIVHGVLAHSADRETDIGNFVKSVVLNFLIAGTDAHGKNYAIVFRQDGSYRLAPLYDINSLIPYGLGRKDRMAMSIGGKYRLNDIQPRHWDRLSTALALDPAFIRNVLLEFTVTLPDIAADTAKSCRARGVDSPILATLVDGIAQRCRAYGQSLILDATDDLGTPEPGALPSPDADADADAEDVVDGHQPGT